MGQLSSTVCRRFELSLVAAKTYQYINGGGFLAVSIISLGVLLGCVVVVKKCHQRPHHMVSLLMLNYLLPMIAWQIVVGLWFQPFVAFPHHRVWMLSVLAPKAPEELNLGLYAMCTLTALIPINLLFIAARCLIPRAPEAYEKFGIIRVSILLIMVTLAVSLFVSVNVASVIRPAPKYHKMDCAVVVSETEMPFIELTEKLGSVFAVYMIIASIFIIYNGFLFAIFRTAEFEIEAIRLQLPMRLYKILFYSIICFILIPSATLMVNFAHKLVDISFTPVSLFISTCTSVLGSAMAVVLCISIPSYRTYLSSCFSGATHFQEESESDRDIYELQGLRLHD